MDELRILKQVAIAVAVLVIPADPAQAMRPASAEEILCSQDAAVIGTVVDVRSHDCGKLRDARHGCYNHLIGVSLQLADVIQPGNPGLHAGDVVDASFAVDDGPPMLIPGGSGSIPMNAPGTQSGALSFPVTIGRITTAAAKAGLVGKRLVLAVKPLSRMSNYTKNQLGEANFAEAYPPSEEGWVRATWPTSACLRWKQR
jgi:hypothetical protein